MEKLTLKSLNEKIANQQVEINKLQFILAAIADKIHFGREEIIKFNRKIKKYGTQEKKS